MNDCDRASIYLTIPQSYGDALGGLWWSSRFDAIERRDGTTLAVADEIRAVLEGVLARSPVPPFPFVLNLLAIMKTGEPGFEALHRAFTKTRGAVNRGRNVGLLIAELCWVLPPTPGSITSNDVAVAIQTLRRYGEHHRPDAVLEPPLTRTEFECRIAYQLVAFDDAALVHWFTHGCGPCGAGGKLAEETESLPERVARLLVHARRRARLVGAATLVPAIDAALTLPPRGRPQGALPLGGYCDVTSRGDPERLLPSQFALDPDEFIRRFAGNELLYFKREEPHDAVRPDRVIVLDQGARTWGSVRLALAAAALSLLRTNPKRCGALKLFATSVNGPVDLVAPNSETLLELLEASDLSPHPGECLTAALIPGDDRNPRDVILLTHRRSLNEIGVVAATKGRASSDRLFALTVDELGRAELSEWAQSGPRSLRAFRVDLEKAESAQPETEEPRPHPQVVAKPAAAWTGDVEPIPFPFRPGLVAEPLHFAFDVDGGWLLIAGRNGVMHGLSLDGSPPEVLPRAFRNGVVLKRVDAVLGVAGGAVVCGRMALSGEPTGGTTVAHNAPVVSAGASEQPPASQLVVAHYNRTTRSVALHVFGPIDGEPRWASHPELHCITFRTHAGEGCALDLATLGRFPFPGPPSPTLISRACLAWDRRGAPPYDVPITSAMPPADISWNFPWLQRVSDTEIYPRRFDRTWTAVSPQRDGKSLLAGAELHRAQFAGDVLALAYSQATSNKLLLLRGQDGAVLGDIPHPFLRVFTLSSNGRRVARQDATRAVVVAETNAPGVPIATAPHAGLHDALAVELAADPFRLTILIGGYRHTFQVANGSLLYKSRWELSERSPQQIGSVRDTGRYDSSRFPKSEFAQTGGWLAVVDRLGQVLLFRHTQELVAAFSIRRERAAAWIPTGVFWGDSQLIGGPATPEAGQKIGKAILAAETK